VPLPPGDPQPTQTAPAALADKKLERLRLLCALILRQVYPQSDPRTTHGVLCVYLILGP